MIIKIKIPEVQKLKKIYKNKLKKVKIGTTEIQSNKM